jgi:beta-lactamase class A
MFSAIWGAFRIMTGAVGDASTMSRLEKAPRRMATLDRRSLLAAAPTLMIPACQAPMPITASRTPAIDLAGLERAVTAIATDARPGFLGVGLMNLENGESYLFNPERPFPMQSVVKLPVGAAVLSEVDGGRLTLDERVVLQETQLSTQFSPVASVWPGRDTYTLGELLEAMVVTSDNTATDVLMKRIGGPGAITAWLASRNLTGIRVDRYERELQPEVNGMPSFRPAWRDGAVYDAARARIPEATRLAAMRAHMTDGRDSATPRGMLEFLQRLNRNDLISANSAEKLRTMMVRNVSAPGRLRAGLPSDAVLAHRTGFSGYHLGLRPACNDVGIFVLADKRAYAIVAFLSGSTIDDAAADALIARVAGAAVRAIG